MANVFDVADFFIKTTNQSEDDQITNLKLNKLLYYAQGVSLARTGKPMFNDALEAWQYGPVVPTVYRKYKVCGKQPIPSSGDVDRNLFTEEEFNILLDVMRELGQYTGSALVSFTHQPGTPWDNARISGCRLLSEEVLKEYFTSHPVPSYTEKITAERVEKLPADWYDPNEDSEWEAYL